MPRACRAVVLMTFSSAGVCFVAAGATVTAVPAAIWWAQEAQATAATAEPAAELSAPAQPLVVPTNFDQWFVPGGQNHGTENLASYLAGLGIHGNSPLAITSLKGRTWGSPESDHHASRTDSWAVDLAVPGVNVPTAVADIAAQRLASALGEPGWTSGNLVKTYEAYRFQLLWKVAGHFNHVHIGVRRI